jgi:hypothetical protein
MANPKLHPPPLTRRNTDMKDAKDAWSQFETMANELSQLMKARPGRSDRGSFELIGLPVFLPVAFCSYSWERGDQRCLLELGIEDDPGERPYIYSLKRPTGMYQNLHRLFERLVEHRRPSICVSAEGIYREGRSRRRRARDS